MAADGKWTFSFGSGGGVTFTSVGQAPAGPSLPTVLWDDVIGQTEAKAAVREAIEGATKHADLYKRYKRRPTKGVLLYGPPGNGKTMLGKAAATALASAHGQAGAATGFIYVKGPEVLHSYLGETERKIRELFTKARDHKARHGYPAVIFIDEAESVLNHRREHSMSSTIVPMFLAEMDGMQETSAFVLLATNRPGALDSAVIREGRIDRKVLVGRPSLEDAEALFRHALRERPVVGDPGDVVRAAVEALYDDRHVLYAVHLQDGSSKLVTLGHFTSGAQIVFLVETAASFAIEREIASGCEDGIRGEDLVAAVVRTLKEQRQLDHPTELEAYCEDFMASIVRLERVRADGVIAKRPSLIARVPDGMEVTVVSPMAIPVPQC